MGTAAKGLNKINFNAFDPDHKLRTAAMRTFSFLPDAAYLKFVYRMRTGKKLNLKNPVTFCDKLNWLKLHDKHEEYTQLVDKLAVREIVKEKIGEGHSFPVLGVWDRFEEIDFSTLPDKFVLKCNHDSGSYKIIQDKNALTEKDIEKLRKHFSSCVKSNPFYAGREYPYKHVKAKIFAEKFMEPDNGEDLIDYKFFCFHGEPKLMFVATDRSTNCKFDFFDMDFNHLDIVNIHPNANRNILKPQNFDEMKRLASTLSKGIKCVRIDFFEINGYVYFGEYTFFHGGGYVQFEPIEWEYTLGSWIDLD